MAKINKIHPRKEKGTTVLVGGPDGVLVHTGELEKLGQRVFEQLFVRAGKPTVSIQKLLRMSKKELSDEVVNAFLE